MPVFNEEEFNEKWEEDNPVVMIPEEVALEEDKDWVMTEEEEEVLIQQYIQAKEEK
jgi:hypothetical protein